MRNGPRAEQYESGMPSKRLWSTGAMEQNLSMLLTHTVADLFEEEHDVEHKGQ